MMKTTPDSHPRDPRPTPSPDVIEAWAWCAIGLAASAALLWGLAFLRLGPLSVYAWGVGIPLTLLFCVPIALWGLIRSLLRHPVFRPSRALAFGLLLATGLAAKVPSIPAPVSTADYRSPSTFRLPFDGDRWVTVSGGDSADQNYSIGAPSTRYAYSFTRLTPDRAHYEGDPLELGSYPCFGAPVLAPAGGVVERAIDIAPDNTPGRGPAEQAPGDYFGNLVIIKSAPGEFVVVPHLQSGSVAVKEGDRVRAGDPIGACGNSGASLYPHVRLYLVNRAEDAKALALAEGLPFGFEGIGRPIGVGDFARASKAPPLPRPER